MLSQVSQQFLTIWKHQSNTQRLVLVVLVISAALLAALFISWSNTPSYSVAFSGLSEADAGAVIEKLDEQGIPYQLRGSGTVMVPSNQVYEIRLKMAREGLPQSGNVGFELFSGNTLGMTEFTQRVNYQRALEGELERTISSLASVSAVRVHVVTPEKSLLSDNQTPTTASITVQQKPGSQLDAAQVRAMTHLVASSVEGLQPENVVVVDVNGSLLANGAGSDGMAAGAQTDSYRAAEMATAADLQRKVQGLLDSALGPNRSVVQASVSMDWTERETTQQSFLPESATIRSSQTVTEVYTTTGGLTGGVPGAATNLPPATDMPVTGDQNLQYLRNEETTNYEITQTETREVLVPGKIERISLSVMVDGVNDQTQLAKLQEVIAAAAGIDETRGDVLAVQSLAFDRSFYQQQTSELEAGQKNDQYWQIGQAVVVGLLLIGLLWYVQRLLKNLRLASSQAWMPIMKPVAEVALPGGSMVPQIAQEAVLKPPKPRQLPEFTVEPPALSEEEEQIQRLILQLADENPSTVADIIQMWLNEDHK